MAIDGNWSLKSETLIGELTGTASLKSAGGKLTGTGHASGTSVEIQNGAVSGDNFSGTISVTHPISLTIHFSGKVSGNSISGEADTGSFGSFSFTGTRA
jgi:hypothetical protein